MVAEPAGEGPGLLEDDNSLNIGGLPRGEGTAGTRGGRRPTVADITVALSAPAADFCSGWAVVGQFTIKCSGKRYRVAVAAFTAPLQTNSLM